MVLYKSIIVWITFINVSFLFEIAALWWKSCGREGKELQI